MECTLATLHAFIACFSWSNLYIDGGISWQDRGATVITQGVLPESGPHDGIAQSLEFTRIDDKSDSPYGSYALGYLIRPSESMEIDITLYGHRSSISTGQDRGFRYTGVELRWFPFKRRD